MSRSLIWIAGMGVVSGAGAGIPATLANFRDGRRNPSGIFPFETSIQCPTFQVEAELPILPERYNASRSLRLTMFAVREAGFDSISKDARVGVCIGTTVASQLNNIPFYDAYRRTGNPSLDAVFDYLKANLATAVADLLGVRGPRMTIVNACSSGTDAIGVAAQWIEAGLCDVAIAGGADEINRVALAGFWSLGVTSTQPCAPFDRDRSGLNLGEGAGILVLESDFHASRHGRKHQCSIAGFGAACDAHHLTAPHPDGRGLDAAIRTALIQAAIDPEQVVFINAHGTATADNDRAEGKVFERIFGRDLKFLSTKGYTGHALGAAGGLEAAFILLGLQNGWIPASAGFVNQADDIPVAPVKQRTEIHGEYALSTSLAFGGKQFRAADSEDIVNLDPVTIRSIGAVTPLGRDLRKIADALNQPPQNPRPLLRVHDDDLSDAANNRQLRRADRFIRMAALAALDASAGMPMDDVGLIVTTGFGPHCRGFKFLDGILDCGDAAALPTDFSHSVHGAAASYVAGSLDLRGPTLTATDFEIGFEQSVLLAQCWLAQKICKSVLVGAVEELGEVMIHCASRMLNPSESFALGEGAVVLALTPGHSEGIAHLNAAEIPAEVDVLIVDQKSQNLAIQSRRTTTFSHYFGQSASITAFQLLGGLLTHQPFDTAATLRTSCNGAAASLLLRRI